jgi:long-chain acyl-CoA synthetase
MIVLTLPRLAEAARDEKDAAGPAEGRMMMAFGEEVAADLSAMPRIGDIPAYHAGRQPDAAALVFEGRTTDWKTLHERAGMVAARLLGAGIGKGDRVAYAAKNSDSFFELFFSASLVGAITVPIIWRLAPREIGVIVADCEAKLLLLGPEQLGGLDEIAGASGRSRVLVTEDGHGAQSFAAWRDEAAGNAAPDLPEVETGDVVLQLYTSGTTGLPKGVMLSHDNLLLMRRDTAEAQMDWHEWREGDVSLLAMPLGHIGGTGWGLMSLLNGVPTIIHAEFAPDAALDAIHREGVSKLFAVPTALQFMVMSEKARAIDTSRLRHILYGASPIALDLLETCRDVFGCGFCQQYGMTETTGTIVYLPPEDHRPERREKMTSAGLPLPGVELRVVHPQTREPLPAGQTGEIETRSKANLVGYHKKEEAFRETLSEDGWLKTGDAGYLDEDGYLYIQDRFKDMIVTGAENVYPSEVEKVVYEHPDVAEVAVIGVPDEKWGEAVKAVVVRKPGSEPSPDDIIAFARERIAGFKTPKSVDFIDALPRNPTGKVLRRALRDRYWEGRARQVN